MPVAVNAPVRWYYRLHGLEHGPIDWRQLQELARSGAIKPSDFVRREGETRWVIATQARQPSKQEMASAEPAGPSRAEQRREAVARRIASGLEADLAAAEIVDPPTSHLPSSATAPRPIESPPATAVQPDVESQPIQHSSQTAVDISPASRAPAVDMTPMLAAIEAASPSPTAALSAGSTDPAVIQKSRSGPAHLRQPLPRNGTAVLALALACLGLFKLALPLGLLSLYLAGRTVGSSRQRAFSRTPLGVAVAAMAVASVDVGVSLYIITQRLMQHWS